MNKKFKINQNYSRLDQFLTTELLGFSRTRIGKMIKDGQVKINTNIVVKKNFHLQIGDEVEVAILEPPSTERKYIPSTELKRLYEDEYLLIIDKPCGISVHPGSGKHGETILDIFRFRNPEINKMEETDRPGIIHRLDKDTSGVLVLAKDIRTMRRMQKQFKKRQVKKTYMALVSGQVRYRNGTINEPISRSLRNRTRFRVVQSHEDPMVLEQAREAITDYTVIRQFENFAFIKAFPFTGRTHQIRVHLSYLGNPILGDSLYGKGKNFKRLALHAYSIAFKHPITGFEIHSYSVLPEVFRKYLREN